MEKVTLYIYVIGLKWEHRSINKVPLE